MTNSGSKISATKGTFTYTKNSNTKTVKLTYNPGPITDKNVSVTVTTAKPNVVNQTVGINDIGYAAGIKGLKADTNTTLTADTTIDFGDLNGLLFLDSYGAVMSADSPNIPVLAESTLFSDVETALTAKVRTFAGGTAGDVPASTATQPGAYDAAFYTVSATGLPTGTSLDAATGVLTAGATEGSGTVTVTLYPVSYDSTKNAWSWGNKVTKTISVSIVEDEDITYSLEVVGDKTLHVGDPGSLVTSPSVSVKLTAADKSGTPVQVVNKFKSVETDAGLVGSKASWGGTNVFDIPYTGSPEISGEGKMTISATVVGIAEPVTCELKYSDAASVAKTSYFQKYNVLTDAYTDSTAVLEDGDTLYVGGKDYVDGHYAIGIQDQYGDDMNNCKLIEVSSGNPIASGDTTFTNNTMKDVQLRLTTGTINQNVTVEAGTETTGGAITPTIINLGGTWMTSTSFTAKTTAELKTALTKAAADTGINTVVVAGEGFSYANDFSISSEDTLYIGESTELVTSGNITINGTITVGGVWNHSTGSIDNYGTVDGLGHAFLNGITVTSHSGAKWDVATDTLVINGGNFVKSNASDDVTLGGHIKFQGDINFGSAAFDVENGTKLTFVTGFSATNAPSFKVGGGDTIAVIGNDGTHTDVTTTTGATVIIANNGKDITGGTATVDTDEEEDAPEAEGEPEGYAHDAEILKKIKAVELANGKEVSETNVEEAVEALDALNDLTGIWTFAVSGLETEEGVTTVTLTWSQEDATDVVVESVVVTVAEPDGYEEDKALIEAIEEVELASTATGTKSEIETAASALLSGAQGTWKVAASNIEVSGKSGTATLTWSQANATDVIVNVTVTIGD